jgi:hypothetical protein
VTLTEKPVAFCGTVMPGCTRNPCGVTQAAGAVQHEGAVAGARKGAVRHLDFEKALARDGEIEGVAGLDQRALGGKVPLTIVILCVGHAVAAAVARLTTSTRWTIRHGIEAEDRQPGRRRG